MSEFRFSIGEAVCLRYAVDTLELRNRIRGDDGFSQRLLADAPMVGTISERVTQECPGGTQYKYVIFVGDKLVTALDQEVVSVDEALRRLGSNRG